MRPLDNGCGISGNVKTFCSNRCRCRSTVDRKSWRPSDKEKLLRAALGEKAGAVMAMEKGTVYGLTVYGQRKVTYTDKDPALCRELFIREALVNGEFETQAPFSNITSSLSVKFEI